MNPWAMPRDIGAVGGPNGTRVRVAATRDGVLVSVELAYFEQVILQQMSTSSTWSFGGMGGLVVQQVERWRELRRQNLTHPVEMWAIVATIQLGSDARKGKLVDLLHQAWAAVEDMKRITVEAELVLALPAPAPVTL